ncbi:unnamed protein product [Adineta ricciae]|uniref:PiggyBac transposable element-derived protein domain-containing protein n=1 Tax=Adineta ricciae TaxID=249248 RepID=A0A815XSI9_ADIRI|nr:unnamed protein product [Adineta ricciae]CAF1561224.1 unnamed protein product [Adineta ricciae]
MIGYKGTTAPTSYRQYMPNKRAKRSFKVWTRCGVSAFMYEMNLYYGASKAVTVDTSLLDSSLKRALRTTTTATMPNENQ